MRSTSTTIVAHHAEAAAEAASDLLCRLTLLAYGVRRISQFDGAQWTTLIDDSDIPHYIWGGTRGPGGIAVGSNSAVYLLGE